MSPQVRSGEHVVVALSEPSDGFSVLVQEQKLVREQDSLPVSQQVEEHFPTRVLVQQLVPLPHAQLSPARSGSSQPCELAEQPELLIEQVQEQR